MTFSLLTAQVLLKARIKLYDYRIPKAGGGYKYYYKKHRGGGMTRAKFEEGAAFKLTWKNRRGHFHIKKIEGDMVTISHDSRPNVDIPPIHKDELRAILKKQHGKAEEKSRAQAQENRRRGRKKRKGSKRTKRKTTPQTQAPEQTPQVQETEQGADHFETMPEPDPSPAREQLTETAREVETPPVKKKRARKPKKFGSSIPSKDELLEEFKGITETYEIMNEGNPVLSQVFKVLNSPNTTKEQKNKFKRGLDLPLLNLNDSYEVASYLSERETRTGRGSDLFLPSALKVHGISLDPFNVSEQAQEETGKVYNLYSSPSATNEESGLAFAFGTIKAEGLKPKRGLWAIHRDSGRLALIDDTVKPHQAPAILTFLGEELKDQLAKVNPDNSEHMKIFVRAMRDVSLGRRQRQADLAEMLARILNDPRLSKETQEPEQGADHFETMPEPDPSPAREQLTETAREVVQDQGAETPPVSKEDLMDEDDDTNEFGLFPSYSQGIWRAFSAFSKDKNLTTNQKKQIIRVIDSVRLRLEGVLFRASQTHPVEMKGYVRQDNKIYLLLDDLADHLGVPLERSKRSLNISSETNRQHMHKLVFGQLKNLDIKKDTTLGEISEKLAEMVAASINTREERARVKEEAREKFRMREEMVNQAAEAGLPWSVAKDIETPKQLERALRRRDKKRKDSEKREEKRREREAEKRKKKAEEAFDRNRRFERFPDEYPQASQARFVRGKAKSTEKQREKRQGQLDQFLQRTGTPAQQQETRGPVTSLAQMSSLSEAPPKFKTMIKRFTSTTKGDPFKRPFVKEGRIYATNGVILFEGPETSLPDGPFNVSGEPVENPPTTPPVVGFIEDLKQKQQHATTFDAETVKHIHGAISALGYKKEKYDDEGVFIEASGNSLTVSHMGVQLASVPLVEGSEIQGSYAIKGVTLKEALSAGGPVSLHLSPLNNEEDLRTPLTFRSRFGNTVIMPASR